MPATTSSTPMRAPTSSTAATATTGSTRATTGNHITVGAGFDTSSSRLRHRVYRQSRSRVGLGCIRPWRIPISVRGAGRTAFTTIISAAIPPTTGSRAGRPRQLVVRGGDNISSAARRRRPARGGGVRPRGRRRPADGVDATTPRLIQRRLTGRGACPSLCGRNRVGRRGGRRVPSRSSNLSAPIRRHAHRDGKATVSRGRGDDQSSTAAPATTSLAAAAGRQPGRRRGGDTVTYRCPEGVTIDLADIRRAAARPRATS